MDIKELLRDERAMTDGVWIQPMGEKEDLRVRTRGLTPQYKQRVEAGTNKLRRRYGKLEDVPPAVLHEKLGALLMDELIIEVQGLRDGGREMPLNEVRALVMEPRGEPLYQLLLASAQMADARREADVEDASGN